MAWAREVVEELTVSEDIDEICEKHERVRELFDGLLWRVSRDPEAGAEVGGKGRLHVIRSELWEAMPGSLALAYRFDDDTVHVIGVQFTPRPGSELKISSAA